MQLSNASGEAVGQQRTWIFWIICAVILLVSILLIFTVAVNAQSALKAPIDIKCEGFEEDTVRIFWNDIVDDETNYRIERSVDGSPFSEIDTLSPDSEGNYNPYRDTGINTSQNLRYRVRSYRSSDDTFSPYSDICNNRRIRETNNFRIFYGLRGIDDCPLVRHERDNGSLIKLREVCLDNTTHTATLDRVDQALEGSLAAFRRIGFSRDASNQRGGLDKPPINVTWCDGGGCAGICLGDDCPPSRGTYMGLAPSMLEAFFDPSTRMGDPSAWLVTEHELMHLQQYQYHGLEDPADKWVTEGQARMSQDKICIGADTNTCLSFDDIGTGYAGYVPQVTAYLRNPNRPVIQADYDAALFWAYLTEKYGTSNTVPGVETGMNLIPEFWDQVAANPGRDGVSNLNDTLAALGHSERFRDIWKDFAVASYAKDLSGPGVAAEYQYEDVGQPGGNYGAPGLSLSRMLALDDQVIDTDETVTQWGARYYEIRPAANVPIIDIDFTQDSSYPLYYTILGIRGTDITFEYNYEGRNLEQTLVNNAYDRVVIIVAGLEYLANYRYSINGTTPELRIVTPTGAKPARVGDPSAPDKFLAKVEIVSPEGTPLSNIDLNGFTFTVGAQTVRPDQVLAAAVVQNQQWFVLRAPTQTTAATYDLTVAYGSVLTGTNTNAVSYFPRNDADNVLLVDRSGSMGDFDKLAAAQAAARLYVDSWRTGDQIGLVSFNDNPVVDLPLQDWNSTSRDATIDQINGLTADGGTAIGDVLRDGWNQLIDQGDTNHDWALILLSDGLETAGDEGFDALIDALKAARKGTDPETPRAPVVYPVAVGPDADRLHMQRLATATGGTYHAVSVPEGAGLASLGNSGNLPLDLSARYRAIATELDGQQQFFSLIGPLGNDGENRDVVTIPVEGSAAEMVLSVSLDPIATTARHTLVELIDPSGNAVAPTLSYFTFEETRHNVWQVSNPQSGNWTLEFNESIGPRSVSTPQQLDPRPQQSSSDLQDYLVQASVRSDLTMDVFLATPVEERDPGVPMDILASLTDTEAIMGASVAATVIDPNGVSRVVTLFDDGTHDDGAANDGLYGGTFYQTGNPGSYSVLVKATGTSNTGDVFTREKLFSFFISGIDGRDNDPPVVDPVPTPDDRDRDGLPDAWEEGKGTDPDQPDADADPDNDGWDNQRERDEGTDPNNSDTDGDGEADSTDSDPLNPAVPPLDPVRVVVYPGNGSVTVRYTPRNPDDTVLILRAPRPDGPFVQVDTDSSPADGEYEDTTTTNGTTYCYTVIVISGGQRYATPTPSCTEPKVDYLAPTGGIIINGNASTTTSRDVELTLFATDFFDPESNADGELGPPDDTATGVQEMMINNNADMSGGTWEPYQTSRNWTLAEQSGLAAVFVKYRDGAGNESDVYPATIEIVGSGTIYLPFVTRASAVTTAQPQPDLVASLSLSPDKRVFDAGEPVQINATITNNGTAPSSPMWVDLFINPSSLPTSANTIWSEVCALDPCFGIAWYVAEELAPGESIMLTSTPESYSAGHTIWPGWFASGTSDLYLYVDSWNPNVRMGAVNESNEDNNRAELHGLQVSGPNPASTGLTTITDLPRRPVPGGEE